MNWFLYLPPIVSIVLIISSGRANLYLRHLIRSYNPQDKDLLAVKPVIEDIAIDWATRVGLINSMFTSLFSALSVYAGAQTFQLVLVTLAVLLIIFILLLYWILSFETDELVAVRVSWFRNRTRADLCSAILIIVNILLIIEIIIVQILPVPSTANPK